jgi:hypothetical protein
MNEQKITAESRSFGIIPIKNIDRLIANLKLQKKDKKAGKGEKQKSSIALALLESLHVQETKAIDKIKYDRRHTESTNFFEKYCIIGVDNQYYKVF